MNLYSIFFLNVYTHILLSFKNMLFNFSCVCVYV